ncbi:MAG: recombinase zinc beta ribbon domain-containing protein, partial [Dehalococcoidia bacterium]
GGQWNVVTIRDILKNSVYTGTYTRFGFRVPRSHEAIIDAKVFRAVQDETESRRPVGRVVNAEPFMLSGLAYCASCGNKMMGVTRRQTWKRKDGRRSQGVYRYYQCQSRNNLSVCDYHTWRAAKLEGAVLSQLPPLLAALAATPAFDNSGLREERHTRVQNAERRFVKAMRRTASGQGSIQTLGWHLSQLDSAREVAQGAGPPVDIDTALAGWESLTVADRQRFLKERIERIVVKDDSIEVVVRQ